MSMKDLSNIVINSKYKLQKRIGSGSYGIVYAAQHCYTGASYAVKIILKNNTANTANNKQLLVELEKNLIYQAMINNGVLKANLLNLDLIEKHGAGCRFLREISLQLKVHKHPNVLSIYKVYDFENSIFVVMDYFPEGDLFATIVDKQRYKDDPFLVKSVFIQMVDAINYCHSKNVFHCDLKPENILVANNGTRVVLADFGLALQEKFIDSNISCGSSYYMSPERIQNFSQGFNTLESHSIHLERLLNPQGHHDDYPHHGNVKFPTSSGDVWSLAIILINLICIRNPWLKASFHDTTFKAFVQDKKVLMKILPISLEVFNILLKYLALNPWERGTLFEFRTDILHCHKLAETGPLSVNSALGALDVITTESQMNVNLDKFAVCPIPIDHVALQRQRSRENISESIEIENNYIPQSNKNDPLNNGVAPIPTINHAHDHSKNTNCADCGFGYDFNQCFGGGNESGTSLMTLSTSYSNYSSVKPMSESDNGSSFAEHQLQLENEKRKAQAAQRDYQLQQQQLQLEKKRQRQLQEEQSLLFQKEQRQKSQEKKQYTSHHHLFQDNGKLFSKLFKHNHTNSSPGPHVSSASQKRIYPQPGMTNRHQNILQPSQPSQPSQPHHTTTVKPSVEAPNIAPEFQSFFPMPGMGHNTKPILSQTENRRKKFITKRRQRRATVLPHSNSSDNKTNVPSTTEQPVNKSSAPPVADERKYHVNSTSTGSTLSAAIHTSDTSTDEPERYHVNSDNDIPRVSQHLSEFSIEGSE